MKNIVLVILIFFSLQAFGQIITYEFKDAMPPNQFKVASVSTNWFGRYTNPELGFTYVIDAKGISVISTITESISRETIRESSRYRVHDGYIFGVHETDSLPCILDGDRYYFGLHRTTPLVDESTEHILKKVDASHYIINFSSNGRYIPCLLTFSGKKLSVHYFDYPLETDIFNFIQSKEEPNENSQKLICLSPTTEEWNKIYPQIFMGEGQQYKR